MCHKTEQEKWEDWEKARGHERYEIKVSFGQIKKAVSFLKQLFKRKESRKWDG